MGKILKLRFIQSRLLSMPYPILMFFKIMVIPRKK